MKNLRKILLSLFFGILINTSAQSITFGHGVLSAFSIFTSVMADEHTAEKAVIKELKIKIYNLDSEPVKRKLVQSVNREDFNEVSNLISKLSTK